MARRLVGYLNEVVEKHYREWGGKPMRHAEKIPGLEPLQEIKGYDDFSRAFGNRLSFIP
ncbi:MAG TPA: hypothetical protein VJA47_04000 [archaeon]|nr:hypothetical protein [archaeon]